MNLVLRISYVVGVRRSLTARWARTDAVTLLKFLETIGALVYTLATRPWAEFVMLTNRRTMGSSRRDSVGAFSVFLQRAHTIVSILPELT